MIIPACMVVAARKRFAPDSTTSRAPGGMWLVVIVLVFVQLTLWRTCLRYLALCRCTPDRPAIK
ncbi:MAG: hypothetical protein ACR5LF_15515 [Symbiopectobacterium sp.]